MRDIHRTAYEFFQKGVDEGLPDLERDIELRRHLATCPDCRMDVKLYRSLQTEAQLSWPETLQPKLPVRHILDAIQAQDTRMKRTQLVYDPLRLAAWVAIMILFILVVNWAIANLRQEPAVTPSPTEEEQVAPLPGIPTSTPPAGEGDFQKIPLQPFAIGEDSAGTILWSPAGDTLFFDFLPLPEDPLYDRGFTTLNVLNAGTGEVCPLSQKLPGPVAISDRARWMPDGRLLTVLEGHGVQLNTPCSEEILDLNDRFSEPVFSLPAWEESSSLFLLQGNANYWLLDSNTLTARPLEQPLPSSGGEDRQSWSPSGDRLAIIQPDPGAYGERSILFVLDPETGQVLRNVQIPYGEEFGTPIIEWLREDAIFVWAFGEAGPLLVDLAAAEPEITPVLPGLFGLEIRYPDEINAATVAADESSGNYHIAFKLNTASDKSTVLYHSETGQVEKFQRDAHTMMLFPDGDFETLPRAEDEPSYADEFELVWVDDPSREAELLAVEGHVPRSYSNLFPRLVPGRPLVAFASSQGVSLVEIPGGRLAGFWSLESEGDPFLPSVAVSPSGEFIAVSATIQYENDTPWMKTLYLIRLEPQGE
jgi:hypothetical protein